MSEPFNELQGYGNPKRSGWWLRLTAPPHAGQYNQALNRQEREHLRHAQLTSFTAPFVLIAPLLLLQQSVELGTLVGILVLMSMAIIALFFNRAGNQVFAALLLVLSMDAVIEGALVTAPGGLGSGWLLTFDLFVVPLITVGVLLNRRFLWTFMVLHIIFIIGDFYLLPHAPDLVALIDLWHGPAVAFARPIIIQLGGGLLCWLAVRSTDEAIVRADRAQLVAELQASIANEKKQLEDGIQELLAVLTKAANGNLTVHAALPQDSALWRISAAIDTLFARLQSGRQMEGATHQLLRDIANLTSLVQSAKNGMPVQWPFPNNGPLDPLIRELRSAFVEDLSHTSFPQPAQSAFPQSAQPVRPRLQKLPPGQS